MIKHIVLNACNKKSDYRYSNRWITNLIYKDVKYGCVGDGTKRTNHQKFWNSPLSKEVIRILEIQKGENVLDIGAGMGPASVEAASKGAHVVAIDVVESDDEYVPDIVLVIVGSF